MVKSSIVQKEEIITSIKGLEAQRSVLGDAIVDPALEALKQKLADLEARAAPVEERRMVTILFFDMVDSTSLAGKLDPEEWRQIVIKMHTVLGEAITTHHGTVAQYLGDGLLAFFGAKEAGEHDPENAIRAALDGLTAAKNLSLEEHVQLRAGIHSGLVVVGDLGDAAHREFTASGDAVNLAARLQSAAPPDGILISHDTYRNVRGVFDLTPRPPLSVKGKDETLQTYLVRSARPRPFRSVTRGVAGVEARTIGREAEIQILQTAYLWSFERHGMVWAQLISDPGVGKSRLMEDMSEWMDLRQEDSLLLRARSFPDDANQPFALVRRMWFDCFQIPDDSLLEQAEAKWVERFKEISGLDGWDEAAHALGLLAGLSFENSPYIGAMRSDPAQVKGRAQVVSRELFRAVRRKSPVIVLLEDLQWTDNASWEYLKEVFLDSAEEDCPNGIFILGAARPEWRPPHELVHLFTSSNSDENRTGTLAAGQPGAGKWGIQIRLSPLSDQATGELARELLQRVENIPEQVIELLVERSEGVPYYTEEIVNWFIDHDILKTHSERWQFSADGLNDHLLPATLQHLLLARLGSLMPAERGALQRGAIFGRHFWTGGVEALGVSAGAETLEHLQPRGFVEVQPESAIQGDTEWSFHHNLLHEVTYESVLKRERVGLHKLAAAWLEGQARRAGRLDEFAGLLGDHCERAGEMSAAVDWNMLAGRRAMRQGAPREARDIYTKALVLLPPDDLERRWQVLSGREEALSVLADAQLWMTDVSALLELAQAFDDDNYLAKAYFLQAVYGLHTGDRQVIDQASQKALTHARCCGNEVIEAKALVLAAVADVNRADKPASVQKIEHALSLARGLDDETGLAYVLSRAAYCYSNLSDYASSHSLLVEQIELDHRLGNRSGEAIGLGNIGVDLAFMGMYKQARVYTEQACTISKALGARRTLAYNLMSLGGIYLDTGDLRNAHEYMRQALQEISRTPDAQGKAYVLCDLGNVLLAMSDGYSASRRFDEVLEYTRNQDLAALECEVLAGLAACAVMQGQLDLAQEYARQAWGYLDKHRWVGTNYDLEIYHSCAETFKAIGETGRYRAVVERGYQVLMEMADRINVPDWRRSFLENVPHNRAITEMWERLKH